MMLSVIERYHNMPPAAIRHRLPTERRTLTHKFKLSYSDPHEGQIEEKFYVSVGLFPDGSPGEIFISTSKSGSTIKGLLDAWAITMSIALQYGVPLKSLTDKLSFIRFEPNGITGEEFGFATSVIDYISRWMAKRFLNLDYRGNRRKE